MYGFAKYGQIRITDIFREGEEGENERGKKEERENLLTDFLAISRS